MTTSTFYCGNEDGFITWNGYDQVFGSNDNGIMMNSGISEYVDGTDEYQSFVRFNTGDIPDGDGITSATLTLYLALDYSTTDLTLNARMRAWGPTLQTTDWLTNYGDYTLVAHKSTNGIGTGAINFIDDSLPANINKTGYTEIAIVSDSRSYTGNAYISWYTANNDGDDPKLVVVHSGGSPTKSHLVDSRIQKQGYLYNDIVGTPEEKVTRDNSVAGGDPFSTVNP